MFSPDNSTASETSAAEHGMPDMLNEDGPDLATVKKTVVM